LKTGISRSRRAKFVFIGAGGGSLLLLQKAGVPEIKGYGGFPIGGQWLVCDDPEIVKKHDAKVYGLSPERHQPWRFLTWIVDGWRGRKPFSLDPMPHGPPSFYTGVEVFGSSWFD
jgi:hypothetical protein